MCLAVETDWNLPRYQTGDLGEMGPRGNFSSQRQGLTYLKKKLGLQSFTVIFVFGYTNLFIQDFFLCLDPCFRGLYNCVLIIGSTWSPNIVLMRKYWIKVINWLFMVGLLYLWLYCGRCKVLLVIICRCIYLYYFGISDLYWY